MERLSCTNIRGLFLLIRHKEAKEGKGVCGWFESSMLFNRSYGRGGYRKRTNDNDDSFRLLLYLASLFVGCLSTW